MRGAPVNLTHDEHRVALRIRSVHRSDRFFAVNLNWRFYEAEDNTRFEHFPLAAAQPALADDGHGLKAHLVGFEVPSVSTVRAPSSRH